MNHDDWKDQYKRMIRWKNRLISLPKELEKFDPYMLQDYLFAFFVNCFHLGDWLKKCGQKDAIQFAIKDRYLGICRGLAHGSKHFILNHEDKTKQYISQHFRINIASEEGILAQSSTGFSGMNPSWPIPSYLKPGDCIVIIGDGEFDLFDLVDACINSWDCYIKTHGLIPPDTREF